MLSYVGEGRVGGGGGVKIFNLKGPLKPAVSTIA